MGISVLQTTYKIVSNILLLRLIRYAEKIIRDLQCGFQNNRSTSDHILCICQILEKKWEYNKAVKLALYRLHYSVTRGILYNILIECGIPKKLVRLIKMCLNESYSRFCVGENLSDIYPIRNVLKQGDVLSPLFFIFA